MAYEICETCMLIPGFSRTECASWVQALGSIAAVVGTWWATKRQLETADLMRRKDALERDLGNARACYFAARDTYRALKFYYETQDEADSYKLAPVARLEELQLTFRALLAKDLTAETLEKVVLIQSQIALILGIKKAKDNNVTLGLINYAFYVPHAPKMVLNLAVQLLHNVRIYKRKLTLLK